MRSEDDMRRLTHTDEAMQEVFKRAEHAFRAMDKQADCQQEMKGALKRMDILLNVMRVTGRPATLQGLIERYRFELAVFEDQLAGWCLAADARDEYVEDLP